MCAHALTVSQVWFHKTCIKSFVFFLDCVQAQVLYDFTAESGNNELTVREGETVTITNQVDIYQHSST